MIHSPPTLDDASASLARFLTERFAGHGETLYLVGGAVRDALLGIAGPDLDFATSARPGTTARILEETGLGRPYRVGEAYGTIALRTGESLIEITTYRSREVYARGSRKPAVEFGRTLDDDLQRRDFTINAMAYDAARGLLIDPLHGEDDLRTGVVRAVGTPEERFREDPLRLLRGVRFASRLGFAIDGATAAAMISEGAELETVSRERIRDEYQRILTGPQPARGLTLLRDTGLMRHSVPQLLVLDTMKDHGPRHPLSLWEHTMRVVEGVPADPETRWAALLHDSAKPATRTHEPSGRPRFFGHEEEGARIAREVLSGLRYSNAFIDNVSCLVETHMQIHGYSPEWTDGAVRRLMVRMGENLQRAIDLARADAAGHSPTGTSHNAPKFDHLEERIARLSAEEPAKMTSPLTGDDLMARYGLPPGPWIRAVKEALEEEVLEGSLAAGDVEAAWRIADALVAGAQDQ